MKYLFRGFIHAILLLIFGLIGYVIFWILGFLGIMVLTGIVGIIWIVVYLYASGLFMTKIVKRWIR